MLWTIFVLLLVLWMLGLVTSYTLGGFIHILLIVAIAVLCIQLISGRRASNGLKHRPRHSQRQRNHRPHQAKRAFYRNSHNAER